MITFSWAIAEPTDDAIEKVAQGGRAVGVMATSAGEPWAFGSPATPPLRQDAKRAGLLSDSHWSDSHWSDSHWSDSHWQTYR